MQPQANASHFDGTTGRMAPMTAVVPNVSRTWTAGRNHRAAPRVNAGGGPAWCSAAPARLSQPPNLDQALHAEPVADLICR